jgi:hypothetical protein
MFLVAMETPGKDRTVCAILITFASGKKRVIHFKSDKPVHKPDVAKEILTRVITGLHDDRTLDGQTDRREFHPGSFLAALDELLTVFNERLLGFRK